MNIYIYIYIYIYMFIGLRPAADPEFEFGLNGLHIESCLACLALMV